MTDIRKSWQRRKFSTISETVALSIWRILSSFSITDVIFYFFLHCAYLLSNVRPITRFPLSLLVYLLRWCKTKFTKKSKMCFLSALEKRKPRLRNTFVTTHFPLPQDTIVNFLTSQILHLDVLVYYLLVDDVIMLKKTRKSVVKTKVIYF